MKEKMFLWLLKRIKPNSSVVFAMMKKLRSWHGLCNIDMAWESVKNGH